MSKYKLGRMLPLLLLSAPLALMSCETGSSTDDDDGGGDSGGGSRSGARISGSVTLSSSVAGSNKPPILLQQSASKALQFKVTADQGVRILNKPNLATGMDAVTLMAVGDAVSNAYVFLYDAEHPEWLSPAAQDMTNTDGEYVLDAYGCSDRVATGECNSDAATNGDAYVDGDPLPFGIYTMLIYKPSTFDPITGVTTDPIVSVLPAFKAETEELTVDEAEAEVSDATPNVVTMFGADKNTDGTETWGSSATQLAGNTAIQITFDMAMSRGSVQNLTVENGGVVSGDWSLSPDWTTATFTPDTALAAGEYTVTVPATTVNVYSNAMGYTATGTFSAVASDSTPPTVTFSSPATVTDVPATTPIRISSNEVLKTNALRVASTPSLGDFPSMTLVDTDGISFIYEVVTTEPLQLGESYSITVSGIQDGAGNAASDLSKSFTVQGASSAEGVDDTQSDATQAAQVGISEIFAKWNRAINERNSATIQSLMSGSFVFEYSVQQEEGFMDYDLNRNGRLSLKEFMNMINDGMLNWEYCDSAVTGNIIDTINVTSADTGNFEFTLTFSSDNTSQQCNDDGGETLYATVKHINGQWKLARMSEGYDHRGTTLVSYELIEALLYETADTTTGEQLVQNRAVLDNFADHDTPLTFKFDHLSGVETYVFLLVNERDPSELGFAFAMSADRLACGTDTTCSATEGDDLQLSVPDPFGNDGLPTGAYPVSDIFDFDDKRDWGIDNPGEIFMWEIIGLKTYSAVELSVDETQPSAVEFIRDLAAVSAVKRFQNPGEFVEMGIEVEAFDFGTDGQYDGDGGGTDDTSLGALEYNIYNGGYDAIDGDFIAITVTVPDGNTQAQDVQTGEARFHANSNIGWAEYPVIFYSNGDGTSTASADIMLYQGWTWVEVTNNENFWEHFQVITTGGKGPEVTVSTLEAFDSTPTSLGALTLDQWMFVDASSEELGTSEGAVTLDVGWDLSEGNANSDGIGGNFDMADLINMLTAGTPDTADDCQSMNGWANMNVHVWNDSGAYTQLSYCNEGSGGASGQITLSGTTVSVSDLKIYPGDNWISLNINGSSGMTDQYETQSSFGVYTDAGSEFVAPVALTSITTTEGTPDENGNWGQGSDWDATAVTTNTSELTMVFKFADPNSPMANIGSDGVCCTNETLTDDGNGNYPLTITLYQGYNWISVQDGNGSWYNVNIYSDNGAEVPRPKFLTANDVDIPVGEDKYSEQSITVDQCMVTLTGTVPGNTERLNLNWNGGDSSNNYWEGQEVFFEVPDPIPVTQDWSATFQLVGGVGSYNRIEAWDDSNQGWAGLQVATSASGCDYAYPELTVDGVRLVDENGAEAVTDDSGTNYGVSFDSMNYILTPITDTSVWVYGTSTVPGRAVHISSHLCGREVKFSAMAGTTVNSSGTYDWGMLVDVYDDNVADVDFNMVWPFHQWLDISDGYAWQNIGLVSDSNIVLDPAITLTLPSNMVEDTSSGTGGCSYVMWRAEPVDTTDSVTINGHTENEDAWGGYGHANLSSSFVDFPIDENGDFEFTMELFAGYNYLWLNDDRGGFHDIQIYTENSNMPPQYLTINGYTPDGGDLTELDTTTEDVSGNVVISGTLDMVNDEQFTPDHLNAYVSICGTAACVDSHYDSTLEVANDYAMPMTYDAANPTAGFSLTLDIPTYVSVYIDVHGCSDQGCHSHSFTFNDDGNQDDYFNKPGQKASDNEMFRHFQ